MAADLATEGEGGSAGLAGLVLDKVFLAAFTTIGEFTAGAAEVVGCTVCSESLFSFELLAGDEDAGDEELCKAGAAELLERLVVGGEGT